jgi:hypothetical protein
MAKPTPKPKTDEYKVTLDMAGQLYFGKGQTVFDAITNLPLTYLDVKTKGELTVQKGNAITKRLLYLKPLRMIIANKLRRNGIAKQLDYLITHG